MLSTMALYTVFNLFLERKKKKKKMAKQVCEIFLTRSSNKNLDVITFYQNYEHKTSMGSNDFQVHGSL